MLHIEMVSITGVDTKWNEGSGPKFLPNFEGIHSGILTEAVRFLNAHQAGGGSPKWAACEA